MSYVDIPTFYTTYDGNSNLIRFYQYDDNYPLAQHRQLGTFIQYINNKTSRVAFVCIFPSLLRDSIVINLKRNHIGDIDTVFYNYHYPTNTVQHWVNVFEYTNTINKFKNNANLNILSYLNTSIFTYGSNSILTLSLPYFTNTDILNSIHNQIFQDILFNSTYLPSKFHVNGEGTFYIKYAFNNNGYVTKLSIGAEPDFDPLINQVTEFTYYRRP